jgi:hypothetical protein
MPQKSSSHIIASTARRQSQPLPGGAGFQHVSLHHHYVPNDKGKRKSRAVSHNKEFLSRVFAREGASRFFKTFLLRFLFDSGKKSAEDYSNTLKPAI